MTSFFLMLFKTSGMEYLVCLHWNGPKILKHEGLITVVAHHTLSFSIVHKANNKIVFKAPLLIHKLRILY